MATIANSGRRAVGLLHAALIGCALSVSARAIAAGAIDAEPMSGTKLRIDGLLKEWGGRFTPLSEVIKGDAASGDPEVAVRIGYDEKSLYVALKIKDNKIVRSAAASKNEDHALLALSFPGTSGRAANHEVEIYPGEPGKIAGLLKVDGRAVPGALVVEAPTRAGLDVEAQIPWSAFPEASRVRVGLGAGIVYFDADRPGALHAVVATSKRTGAPSPLRLEAEQALQTSLIGPKRLAEQPARQALGNVAGDGFVERVAIYGGYLTIVGPHYRGGSQFYFGELGVASADMVTRLELADFDGDGVSEIVIQKRLGTSERYRDVLHVLKVMPNDALSPVFAHEVAIKTPDGALENQVKISKSAGSAQIEIAQGTSEGFEADSYNEPLPSDMPGALLPWQTVGTRTFRWQGDRLEKVDEGTWTPKTSGRPRATKKSAPAEPPAPPPPRPPSPDELLDRVYALYRKERGVGAERPRFDFVTDVAGDTAPERVLVHGKDIVVFGKGFRGGTTFAFITIGVADPKDVLDVTARDLTLDGKAEIVVRGVLHAKASKALGGDVVDRHALFIYRVGDAAVARVFAAETGRGLGDNRILGGVALKRAGRALSIELRKGRALGWTEQTYPFPPDTTAAGGLEPLLLPWSESDVRRYRFDGNSFVAE